MTLRADLRPFKRVRAGASLGGLDLGRRLLLVTGSDVVKVGQPNDQEAGTNRCQNSHDR